MFSGARRARDGRSRGGWRAREEPPPPPRSLADSRAPPAAADAAKPNDSTMRRRMKGASARTARRLSTSSKTRPPLVSVTTTSQYGLGVGIVQQTTADASSQPQPQLQQSGSGAATAPQLLNHLDILPAPCRQRRWSSVRRPRWRCSPGAAERARTCGRGPAPPVPTAAPATVRASPRMRGLMSDGRPADGGGAAADDAPGGGMAWASRSHFAQQLPYCES